MRLLILSLLIFMLSCSHLQEKRESSKITREIASVSNQKCVEVANDFFETKESVLDQIIKKQKKHNFILEDKTLYQMRGREKTRIGEISIINPKFLFEWADKDMHKYWLKDGGITKSYMDFLLSEPPQSYGRGYYVSLSPTDSSSYGDSLTIFEVTRPIVIIKMDYYDNEKLFKELRDSGYGGIKCSETWLNIFNERYLSQAQAINSKTLDQMLDIKNGVPDFDLDSLLEIPTIKSRIPKFSKEKIIPKETQLFNYLTSGHEIDTDILSLFSSETILKIIPLLKSQNNGASSIHKILKNLSDERLSRLLDTDVPEQYVNDLRDIFEKNTHIRSFFTLFDLFDVASIGNKNRREPLTYRSMMKATAIFEKRPTQMDLTRVQNHNDFVDEIERLFKLDYSIRNFEVTMSPHNKSASGILLTSRHSDDIQRNRLLSFKQLSHFNDAYIAPFEIDYFSVKNLEAIKSLISLKEYQQIKNLAKTAPDQAIKLAIDLILPKLFDPSQFEILVKTLLDVTAPLSPFSLYKIFVGLHPFGDGNGRAARIYYEWLTTNHFKKDVQYLRLQFFDQDILVDEIVDTPEQMFDWYLTRLWVISAETEEEMTRRAYEAIARSNHHFRLIYYVLKDQHSVLHP